MKVLITGHCGFIGSKLIQAIKADGIDLVTGQDILTCDLPDADVVIHLAAQSDVMTSMDDAFDTAQKNVAGTVRLLERYKHAKFIFASSGGAIQYSGCESPYGLSKRQAEEYIRMIHDNFVILRLGNVYGPGSRCVIDKFKDSEELVIYGDGRAIRTYVHVDDVVQAFVQALDWGKGRYDIGGETYNLAQLAMLTGKKVVFKPWRKGELLNGRVETTAPDWKHKISVKDYLCTI